MTDLAGEKGVREPSREGILPIRLDVIECGRTAPPQYYNMPGGGGSQYTPLFTYIFNFLNM